MCDASSRWVAHRSNHSLEYHRQIVEKSSAEFVRARIAFAAEQFAYQATLIGRRAIRASELNRGTADLERHRLSCSAIVRKCAKFGIAAGAGATAVRERKSQIAGAVGDDAAAIGTAGIIRDNRIPYRNCARHNVQPAAIARYIASDGVVGDRHYDAGITDFNASARRRGVAVEGVVGQDGGVAFEYADRAADLGGSVVIKRRVRDRHRTGGRRNRAALFQIVL